MYKLLKILLFNSLLLVAGNLHAQFTADTLHSILRNKKYDGTYDDKSFSAILSFYSAVNYKTIWFDLKSANNRNIFFDELKLAAYMGLREKDYQYALIASLKNGSAKFLTLADSLEAEIQMTAAALHFYSDIAYGNTMPDIAYKGLIDMPLCNDVPALLARFIYSKNLIALSSYLSSPLLEITVMQSKIKWFTNQLSNSSFDELIINSDKASASNKVLVSKLYQLGFVNDTINSLPDSVISQYIKQAQLQFGLLVDGKLSNATLHQLNITLLERLHALNLSINYYRWLSCFSQSRSVIVVNIPAAYLKVYNQQKVQLEMKIIVGKKSTPTPTLLSTVNEVVLYPYWHVPYSIATKEILPKLKRSASFIDAGNYQVLNKAGNIINPYSVKWRALSTKYFPYTIRQSTGCDNALGLLKLNFNSPAGVYLHDTPNKKLFSLNKRFLSHGCMRMQNPTALGHLVLKNNSIAIDTLTQKGCLLNQAPIFVRATDPMTVLVWYNPAGIDAYGNLLFFEDVYGKFNWSKKN